jgi:hypothetical protein
MNSGQRDVKEALKEAVLSDVGTSNIELSFLARHVASSLIDEIDKRKRGV